MTSTPHFTMLRLRGGMLIAFLLIWGSWTLTTQPVAQAAGPTNVPGGTISTDTTWDLNGSPYIVQGGVAVAANVTLTIEAGVEVRFVTSAYLDIYGHLTAQGQPGQIIIFTSDQASPQAGNWYGLTFHPGSSGVVAQCDLSYGGQGVYAALVMYSSNVSLQSCRLHHNQNEGVLLQGGGLTPTLTTLEIDHNGAAAIRQTEAGMSPTYTALNFHDNLYNGIYINGASLTQNGVLDGARLAHPFIVVAQTVGNGATLTITPGTAVQMLTGAELAVYGTLNAQGTAGQPITFTSAISVPQAGDWYDIVFYGGSTGTLANCEVSYAGRGSSAALILFSSNVNAQNCRLHHNQNEGVLLQGGGLTPTITSLEIDHNGAAAIRQTEAGMSPTYTALNFHDNLYNGIYINGTSLTQNGVLDGARLAHPFIVVAQTVGNGTTLTITPGTAVQMLTGAELAVYGTLNAQGTAGQPITFTSAISVPQAGDWYDIVFYGGSSGTLTNCDVSYAGRGSSAALILFSSNVNAQNCRLHHNQNEGVLLQGGGLTPTLTTLEIDHNGAAAIRQTEAGMSPTYTALNFHDNLYNGIYINGASLTQNGVLDGARLAHPFILVAQTVGNGTTLTITPGTTVQMLTGAELAVYGTLNAQGTAGQPITFTSAISVPQAGDWYDIVFYGGSFGTLTNCEVSYAGRGSSAALILFSSNVTAQNCRVHHNQNEGVYLQGDGIKPTLTALRLDANGGAAIRQSTINAMGTYRALTATGNLYNAVLLGGGVLSDSLSLDSTAVNMPLWVNSDLRIPVGRFLALAPGSGLQFFTGTTLYVDGALHATGTPTALVTLSATMPFSATWYGIQVSAGGFVLMNYCDLSGAGRGSFPALQLASSSSVQNCRLHDNAGDAIQVINNARPAIVNNQIYSNAFGVRNTNPGTVVDARHNWWGHPSGPQHTSNPPGVGNAVSDGVLFDPWLLNANDGGPLVERLFVQTGGPARASAGQTIDYAVFYLNQLSQTIQSAVLVLALPYGSEYVESTGGGVYWAERHQVFWRLGDVARGDFGTLSARVRYAWGLPDGLQDVTTALLGGTNLNQAAFNVQPYLDYATPTVISEAVLTDPEIAAVRAASADFDLIYTEALSSGLILGGVNRVTLNTGTLITEAILLHPTSGAVLFLRHKEGQVLASWFDRSVYAIRDTTGGITFTLATDEYEAWGEWLNAPPGPSSPQADLKRAHCMLNCMLEKLPKYTIKKISSTIKTLLSVNDCIKCATSGDKIACTKCASKLGKSIPGLSETLDLYKCGEECAANLASHVCTGDLFTCEAGWFDVYWLMGVPHYGIIKCNTTTGTYGPGIGAYIPCAFGEKCAEGIGCIGCQGNANLASRFTDIPLSAFQPSTPQSICKIMAEAGIGCSSQPTTIRIARDPNAKYGPTGDLVPGQWLTYTITYENEGQGNAYGVFVMDALSPYLDESTLTLYGTGEFVTATRTIFWEVGELTPKGQAGSTGAVSFTVQLKSNLLGGTVVMNQAIVHFPSVPEQTPTNVIVNVVQPVSALPQELSTGAGQAISITLRGLEVSGAPLTYTLVADPLYGQITGTLPNLTYIPANNFTGEDRFAFTVRNALTESRPAEVHLVVLPSANDVTAPQVAWTEPISGAVFARSTIPLFTDSGGPAYGPALVARFSEALSETTVTTATVFLLNDQNQPLNILVSYDGRSNQITLAARSPLQGGQTYTVRVTTGVKDASGNALATEFRWQFSVAEATNFALFLPLVQR